MILQLTPVAPPVLRRGQRDGPGGHVTQGQEEAPGEDRKVPGRWRCAGEFSVVTKFCADFLLNLQLTPAIPPVLRSD